MGPTYGQNGRPMDPTSGQDVRSIGRTCGQDVGSMDLTSWQDVGPQNYKNVLVMGNCCLIPVMCILALILVPFNSYLFDKATHGTSKNGKRKKKKIEDN